MRSVFQRMIALGLLVGVLGGALHPSSTRATTLRYMDTRELALSADAIVLGEVVSVRSEWEGGRRRIVTRVGFRVDDTLKGSSRQSLEIVQLGGEVDGVKVTVPGCPSFVVGEEALLFLSRTSSGRLQVTGMEQGKFDVRRDVKSGRAEALRPTRVLAGSDASQGTRVPRVTRIRLPLEDLLAEVRAYVVEDHLR